MRNLLVGAALFTWACAEASSPEIPDDIEQPRAGSGGKAGSGAQSGSGGTALGGSAGSGGSGATGGTLALGGTSGAAATGGSSGAAGSGGSSGSGGAAGMGGMPMGGTGGVAGNDAAGGSDAAGGTGAGGIGTGGVAGNASGGVANAGAGGAVGGAGGIPNDPNWMPPDMSDAKIVVLYKCDARQTMGSNVAMTLYLKNQTDEPYPMADVTVRYWLSSEPPPQPALHHSATNLSAKNAVFVPNMAVSYLEWSFGATGTLPAYVDQNTLNNNGVIQAGVQSTVGVAQFNQANDWSFDATAVAAKENPKITVYDGDTLIYGCEPSRVCAEIEPEPMGEAGASGEL